MATTTSTTGVFTAANGEIIGPNGQPFIADGIDLYDSQIGSASQVLQSFPGINMVRLAVEDPSSTSAASLSAFINQMTSAGVVVEIEDHSAPSADDNVLTGSALSSELSWYSSVASAYANNPYVWFGTMNEPDDTSNEAAVSSQEQQIYNTIRAAGNNNPIMLEQIGGYTDTGLVASDYASMTNVIWDSHYYGWVSNYSTNQATVDSDLSAQIANAQSIKTAEGVVPVIVGEYGISTTGSGAADPNGNQVLTAVQSSGVGSLAWAWSAGTDQLYNGSSLTSYGQEVANYIATAAASRSGTGTGTSGGSGSSGGGSGNPPGGTTTVTPSPNDTVVTAGSTAAITDASGNKWSITSGGQVAVNGVADTTTANVIELAYVNGTIWQENSSDLWWSETSPGAGWNPPGGTSTSPLPANTSTGSSGSSGSGGTTTKITPSANDTMIVAGSTSLITDASGNKWSITSSGQVAVNGVADTTTANVTLVAYVNGTIWQENSSNLWWSETAPGAGWNPPGGTSTIPVPHITISPSQSSVTENVSNTMVTATSGNHMVFIGGTGNVVLLSGGTETVQANAGGNVITTGTGSDTITLAGSGSRVNAGAGQNTITDNGTGNTFVLPTAGSTDMIHGAVLTNGDSLDLRTALASTSWNDSASTLSNYLSVNNSGGNASIVLHPTGGTSGSTIATLYGAGTQTLSTVLQHSIT